MGRTVVLHPGALGDVLLSIPALRALRAGAPGDELVLAAQPRIGALLTSLAIVDRHVTFDTLGLDTLFMPVSEALGSPPARLRALVAGARVVSWFGARDPGFSGRLAALAPGALVSSTAPPPHTAVWRHLLGSIGADPSAAAAESRWCEPVSLAPAIVAEGRRALGAAGWNGARPLVMLHPGAGGAAKCWAPDGFAAVAEVLVNSAGVDVVMHDGPADHAAVASLRARLRVPALELVDPQLETLAGALGHVALWVGNDSGVSHLAAAVGAPALVLFTEANLAWRPWARPALPLLVTLPTLSRLDVDGVNAAAMALLRPRDRRAVGAPGAR